jgi:hypothetical protein
MITNSDGSRHTTSPRPRVAAAAITVLLGLIAGASQIINNGIGWHLGGGRWILANHRIPHTDPFSFTSGAAEWINHEWLFQILVAAVEGVGGGPLLVLLRAMLVAALALLLLELSLAGGLEPPAALVLTATCVYGAWIRFLLRPELFTLLIVPIVVWLFLHRDRRWAIPMIAALTAVGVNLHGGVLVAPPLVAGLLAAELIRSRIAPDPRHPSLASGALALGAVTIAPMLNPYGWRLYAVPLHISELVGLPHIPNPEWISPSFNDAPQLYAALALAVIVLAARERDPTRWMLLLMAAALAIRHVRNVGLFFMLLPIAVAPALARVTFIRTLGGARRSTVVAGAMTAAIALSIVLSPAYVFRLGFAEDHYPHRACEFLETNGLLELPVYNDVRFGGYLIYRYHPPFQVFLDDRNEIHEPLLREIYDLFQASDVAGWRRMLDRWGIETALVRYNHSFRVVSPSGEELGHRGFSTLWFPSSEWALIYWDDTAMVLVRRAGADPDLLERFEYLLVRPDDIEYLEHRVRAEPELRGPVSAELTRKLEEEPDSRRALDLAERVLGIHTRDHH